MSNSNDKLVSVIVPVYKVEEYLDTCVKSILNQDHTNFELLLVDDGSPDRSGEMCDAWAEKDKRIRVIHKKNGGLSDARNAGIDASKGEFLTFIDSDDYVTPDYISYMLNALLTYDADIAQGNITTFEQKLGTIGKDRHGADFEYRVFEKDNAIRDYLLYKTHYSNSTVKLFRKTLFENIRFPVGKYSEDEYTTYRLVLRAVRTVCLPKYIYFYYLREGSIVRTYVDKRFEVCRELPDIIRKELGQAGYDCKAEADYKDMRLQIKIYNDFAQGGQYKNFKAQMKENQKRIRQIKPDRSVWDKKYIIMRLLISYLPPVYRLIVFHGRKKLRGSIVKKAE